MRNRYGTEQEVVEISENDLLERVIQLFYLKLINMKPQILLFAFVGSPNQYPEPTALLC
jgi:hypothetical protein